MLNNYPFYIILFFAIVFIIVLANKIKVAYPVLLVIAGLIISLIPGVPAFHVAPEVIFHIFLPPLLFGAAWNVSWKELWKWRRIISGYAFIIVFITAGAVAVFAKSFIPGFTLALGFLLGAIVSPPDAVSAGAIMKFVKVPRRVSSILEGESLLNDASALIILRFALIAVMTGQFIWQDALLSFGWTLAGGVSIGLAVGYIFMQLQKRLTTDVNINIMLTFITPYAMYLLAEEAGASGVLAVVSGGLLLSAKRYLFLNFSSRLRSVNVWNSIIFMMNGVVFMLIGLELPEIIHGLQNDGTSLKEAIGYGILVTVVLIIGRILSVYGTVGVTMIARNFITVADSRFPGYRFPLLIGWSGMRGVVSLAAALSIPVQLTDGSVFPQRSLILFITFIVILLTLLIQGLTLPLLIKKLKISDPDRQLTEDEEYDKIRNQLITHSVEYIKDHYSDKLSSSELDEIIHNIHKGSLPDNKSELTIEENVYFDILDEQRRWLFTKNKEEKELDEELIRRYLKYIDLEEEKLRYDN